MARICGHCKKEIPFVICVVIRDIKHDGNWVVCEGGGGHKVLDGEIFCGPSHAKDYAWEKHRIHVR